MTGVRDGAGDTVDKIDHHEEQSEEKSESARDGVGADGKADPADDDHECTGTEECVHVDELLPVGHKDKAGLEVRLLVFLFLDIGNKCYMEVRVCQGLLRVRQRCGPPCQSLVLPDISKKDEAPLFVKRIVFEFHVGTVDFDFNWLPKCEVDFLVPARFVSKEPLFSSTVDCRLDFSNELLVQKPWVRAPDVPAM